MIENDSKLQQVQRSISAARPPANEGGPPETALSRLRLLTVLDALLVTGSVTAAADALDLSPAAVSRMLAQLRVLFSDELMVRSGRGLVPTALADTLRPRLRALVFEAEQLIAGRATPAAGSNHPPAPGSSLPAAPPGLTQTPALDGQPDALQILARRGPLDSAAPATLRLARHVATLGAGPGVARPLDRAEAEEAFGVVLDGEAHEVQIGALLVAMQMRGITAAELAGLVAAARRGLAPLGGPSPADIDWPAYISPRNRRSPWFLLAARLMAEGGYRVVLHGLQSSLLPYAPLLDPLGIPVAASVAEAAQRLVSDRCVFLPLPVLHPQLSELLQIYRLFDMRSALYLGTQLLNPLAAPATLMGPPSATQTSLHREAAGLLGQPRLMILDSHRDVAQATPHRLMRLTLATPDGVQMLSVPPGSQTRPQSAPGDLGSLDYALGLWTGTVRDAGALATVLDTTAAALIALGDAPPEMDRARDMAQAMWQARSRRSVR